MFFGNYFVARKPFPRVGKISSPLALRKFRWQNELQCTREQKHFVPKGYVWRLEKQEKAIDSPITTAKLGQENDVSDPMRLSHRLGERAYKGVYLVTCLGSGVRHCGLEASF